MCARKKFGFQPREDARCAELQRNVTAGYIRRGLSFTFGLSMLLERGRREGGAKSRYDSIFRANNDVRIQQYQAGRRRRIGSD